MKARKHVLDILRDRELGTKSTFRTSLYAMRRVVAGPRRRWKLVTKLKEASSIEDSGDLLWITKPKTTDRSVVKRVGRDGRLSTLWSVDLQPRMKEMIIYKVPDPVFRPWLSPNEYRPVVCMLRKGNIVSRIDLKTGQEYQRINTDSTQTHSMSWCYSMDVLVVKSTKMKLEDDLVIHFTIFHLHPFRKVSVFSVDGKNYPAPQDQSRYGKLRDAEMNEDMLLIVTDKNFILVYNFHDMLKLELPPASQDNSFYESCHDFYEEYEDIQPILFATKAHMDILGMGGCPWVYIRSVSDTMLEVRDLASGELISGGQVTWENSTDQAISPDYLMFHLDDSNRLIHIKTSDLRVLNLEIKNGKRGLREEFRYSNYLSSREETLDQGCKMFSRSGRRIKGKYTWDDSYNRALAFQLETDLDILVILEAKRDIERNCTLLERVTLFDSFNYEVVGEVLIEEYVDGDIETNKFNVGMDLDILNIISKKNNTNTFMSFRLIEAFDSDDDSTINQKGNPKSKTTSKKKGRRTRRRNGDDEDAMETEQKGPRRRGRGRGRSSVRVRRNYQHDLSDNQESEDENHVNSDGGGDDEWVP
ncbi:DDB1- and CUL4-associated factor 17-like [Oratosquilla oratoria]|uniref:DDB1- and CUL4-associated factor 17-like n=1 Tax=Oratosquilla oratoria TaxID=337810 RepID=UPI003F766209